MPTRRVTYRVLAGIVVLALGITGAASAATASSAYSPTGQLESARGANASATATVVAARLATASTGVSPAVFVASSSKNDLSSVVKLYSARTGRVLAQLASFGDNFTNNGLALSPDGRYVYVTLIGKTDLYIEKISTSTRRRTFLAYGDQPAVSPNGRYLAYSTGLDDDYLTVRQLASGRTTTFDLSAAIGKRASLLGGQIAWLGNGTEIAALPEPDLTPTASSNSPRAAATGACRWAGDKMCLIVVDIASATTSSRVFLLPGSPGDIGQLGTYGPSKDALSLVVGTPDRTLVERVTISHKAAREQVLTSLSSVLVMAVNPSADGVLYLVGHAPPALWAAQIRRGRLVSAHRIIPNSRLESVAW